MLDTYLNYLGYFFLGLGLNLTPCIYPMLTITLSIFRGSKDRSHWHTFGRAATYVAGIIMMYTFLGVSASFTGEFFGSLLQNFWVLLLISAFIMALSLSMFGLYAFRLPSWLVPQPEVSRHSLIGLFVSGMLVGVIAAPCMGPVVLALLAHTSREKDVVGGAISFLILASGLGLPYLILGTFTGLMRRLPRSGAWLIWFERALGVALLTFGFFYLITAFRWPVLPWLMPLALLGGGIYLGWFERSSHEAKKFILFKKVAGTLISVIGLMMVLDMTVVHPKPAMVWEKYRAGILEEAQAARQPVILDFYADWCIPCHELDQFTYSDPGVMEFLKPFRKIKVDTTSVETKEVEDVINRFEVYGVPSIFFLDSMGREVEELRIAGYIPPEEFLAAVRSSRLVKERIVLDRQAMLPAASGAQT